MRTPVWYVVCKAHTGSETNHTGQKKSHGTTDRKLKFMVERVPSGMMKCIYRPYGATGVYLPSLWDRWIVFTVPVKILHSISYSLQNFLSHGIWNLLHTGIFFAHTGTVRGSHSCLMNIEIPWNLLKHTSIQILYQVWIRVSAFIEIEGVRSYSFCGDNFIG